MPSIPFLTAESIKNAEFVCYLDLLSVISARSAVESGQQHPGGVLPLSNIARNCSRLFLETKDSILEA